MGIRKAALAAVTTCVLSAAAMQSTAMGLAPAAVASPVHVNVIEFNLAGWTQHAGGPAPAQLVVDAVHSIQVDDDRPVALALNEVCAGQFEVLRSGLATLGYTAYFAASRHDASRASCESFGNALVIRGQVALRSSHTYVAQSSPTAAEKRNILCARAMTAAGDVVACVTHLVPRRFGRVDYHKTTQAQAAEALLWVQQQPGFAAAGRLVGGDFNLLPGDPALSGWYADSSEGDPSNGATRDNGAKVDYIFGNKLHFTVSAPAALTPVAESDHHLYLARFQRTIAG